MYAPLTSSNIMYHIHLPSFIILILFQQVHDCKPAAIVEGSSSEALPTPSRKRKFDQGGQQNALLPELKSGRWTDEEHQLFLQGLEQYGKIWKMIATLVKSRTIVQVRSHGQKHFQAIALSSRRYSRQSSTASSGASGKSSSTSGGEPAVQDRVPKSPPELLHKEPPKNKVPVKDELLKACIQSATADADGNVDPQLLERAIGAGYSKPPVPKVTACPSPPECEGLAQSNYHLQFLSQLPPPVPGAQPPALPKSSRALVGVPSGNTKDQTTVAEQQQAAQPYGKAAVIPAFRYEKGKLKKFHDEHYNPAIEKLKAAAKVSQSTRSHYGNNKHKSMCIYCDCKKNYKPTKEVYIGLCGGHYNTLITAMSFHHIISDEAEQYIEGLVAGQSCHDLSIHLDLHRLRLGNDLQVGEIDPDDHFDWESELYKLDAWRVWEVIVEHDRIEGTPVRVFRLSCGRCRIPTCEEAEFLTKTFNCDFSNIVGYDAKSHIILLVNYDISKPCVRVQVLRYLSIFGADIVKGCKYVDGKWQPVDFSNLYSQQFLGMYCTRMYHACFLSPDLSNQQSVSS